MRICAEVVYGVMRVGNVVVARLVGVFHICTEPNTTDTKKIIYI